MYSKPLEWAQSLRGELLERIEHLRTVLADVAPLQAELQRLEEQSKGVDRLINLYLVHSGYSPEAPRAQPIAPPQADASERQDIVPALPPPPPSLTDAARDLGRALHAKAARTLRNCRIWTVNTALNGRARVAAVFF